MATPAVIGTQVRATTTLEHSGARDRLADQAQKTHGVVDKLLDAIQLQRDQKGVWKLCGIVTFTWRDLVMLGGIIAAVTLAVASFFSGMVVLGIGFILMGAMSGFGLYLSRQLTDLLPFSKLSVAFKSLVKGANENAHGFAKLLVDFLDALNVDQNTVLDRMDTHTGKLEDNVTLLEAVRVALSEKALKIYALATDKLEEEIKKIDASTEAGKRAAAELLERVAELSKMREAAAEIRGAAAESHRTLESSQRTLEATQQMQQLALELVESARKLLPQQTGSLQTLQTEAQRQLEQMMQLVQQQAQLIAQVRRDRGPGGAPSGAQRGKHLKTTFL